MKKTIFAAVILAGMSLLYCAATPAQGRDDSKGKGPALRGGRERPAALTDAQKATIQSILENYDAASLTAPDAQAIHRAFRDAGIRPCPGMRDAIEAAGFDPEKLRSFDPPPDRRGPGRRRGSGPVRQHSK